MILRRTVGPAVAAAVLAAALAGCTAPPSPDTATPAPTPEGTRSAEIVLSGGDAVRQDGTVVPVGGVELWVRTLSVVDPTVSPADGADVQVGVTTPESPVPRVPVLDLAGPPGSTVDVLDDDSVVVRDAGGAVVAGIGAPVLDEAARAAGARVEVGQDGPDAVSWDLVRDAVVRTDGAVAEASVPAASVAGILSAGALESATWRDLDDEGGRSLAVVPSSWARTGSLAAEELLWAQLAAQEPDAATQGVRDQLTCHVIGAPDKASWNLEPWRPDVGLLATLAARCNPS